MSLKEIENESHPDNRRNDQFKYTHSHTCVTRQTYVHIYYIPDKKRGTCMPSCYMYSYSLQ